VRKKINERRGSTDISRVYLEVKVYPRSRNQGIEEENPGELRLKVQSPPSKGEANREVIKLVASHFGLSPSRVKIVRGLKSRQKLLSLEVDKRQLLRFDNKKITKEEKG